MSQGTPGKKILIDEDWKEEAQREKEKLEEQLEQEKAQVKDLPPLPAATFEVLLSSLATPAMIALGMLQVPGRPPSLEEAKFYVDLLEVLEQKTKGNLDTREHNALTSVLYELRMVYVSAVQQMGPKADKPS